MKKLLSVSVFFATVLVVFLYNSYTASNDPFALYENMSYERSLESRKRADEMIQYFVSSAEQTLKSLDEQDSSGFDNNQDFFSHRCQEQVKVVEKYLRAAELQMLSDNVEVSQINYSKAEKVFREIESHCPEMYSMEDHFKKLLFLMERMP